MSETIDDLISDTTVGADPPTGGGVGAGVSPLFVFSSVARVLVTVEVVNVGVPVANNIIVEEDGLPSQILSDKIWEGELVEFTGIK